MTKRQKKQAVPLTPEEMINDAKSKLCRWDDTPLLLLPPPTRMFNVGDSVQVGNLHDVVVVERLHDGYAYVCSYTATGRDVVPHTEYICRTWIDVEYPDPHLDVDRLFSTYRRYPTITSDLSSIVHYINRGGLVCDPTYQRDYVWSEANKDALIESIFDRLDIGSVLFVRHAGFNHPNDHTTKQYKTLDGRDVAIERCNDYTTSIIDGQQRLRTITDFIFDRRPYKGLMFSQLNAHDQREFMDTSMTVRMVEEEQVTEKEIIRMFLQSNRGVPQTPEHLQKVQAYYESMK